MSAPRLLAPAEDELRSATQWYEARRDGLGVEFVSAVVAALRRVASSPEAFAAWSENPRFRRAIVSKFPYILYFRVIDGTPVIFAVAHTSRRPDYWLTRLPK